MCLTFESAFLFLVSKAKRVSQSDHEGEEAAEMRMCLRTERTECEHTAPKSTSASHTGGPALLTVIKLMIR